MKIGIVTVYDVNNFGSFLQAYALQYYLEEKGHDVYFIKYATHKYIRGLFYRIRPYGEEWKSLPKFIEKNFYGWQQYRAFVKNQKSFKVLKRNEENAVDLIILGSDEIWNVQNPLFRNPIFYGKDMRNVVAYAASIGDATMEDMKTIPREYFYNMKEVMVRDAQTQNFIESLEISTRRVCDPTLLVDKKLFKNNYRNKLLTQPYILIYSYPHHLSTESISAIKQFATNNGLRIISVCFNLEWCDGVINCSPLDFFSVLEQAEYVITSTFHGTIFSILSQKQFVCLAYSLKTIDLLRNLKLEERNMSKDIISESVLNDLLITRHINYSKVEDSIQEIREESSHILDNAIYNSL